MSIHIFGIRHHGPGCARSLCAALETLQPDIVLVEGPPDAQDVLPLLLHDTMEPPVALLIYPPDKPQHAVYYPFTHFSPEWQALRYALTRNIPARFMDLPQAIQLAKRDAEQTNTTPPAETGSVDPIDSVDHEQSTDHALQDAVETTPSASAETDTEEIQQKLRVDPLALLAEAAGYTDHELWWEQQIEQRHDVTDLFPAILEAMTAIRAEHPSHDIEEEQREAYMRQTIRAAQKEGFQRIAVVCGAWHAPVLTVLTEPGAAQADTATLKGLKRIPVTATWIPWTNSRLAYRSGYGAGITSPGWYTHLWTTQDRGTIRWLTYAAQLLRQQDLDASSASVIEAVRLAEALTALRDLQTPGLAELHEAIQTVLCHGETTPMQLIRDKLEIGEKLGHVPDSAPAVPLQRDLALKQRELNLKPSAEITKLDLDLRNSKNKLDRGRSQLLHRLNLLKLPWGQPLYMGGAQQGSFHEYWQLQWQVEFTVSLIETNIWGNTIETAASAMVMHEADISEVLPQLTTLLDKALLAELPGAVDHLLNAIQQRAALSTDLQHLMRALPPLAQVARYSDVRQTRVEHILPIIASLFQRITIGLPGACASLDDDAAQQMLISIEKVQETISLLDDRDQRAAWLQTLNTLQEKEHVHGLVRGRCCRLLLEQNALDEQELQRIVGLTLSPAIPAQRAASWVEGVLGGRGLTLLHQDSLWLALDHWLNGLTTETFEALLPILRRAFATFQTPERRKMGEKVAHLHTSPGTSQPQPASGRVSALDTARAAQVLPVLASIMGVTYNG